VETRGAVVLLLAPLARLFLWRSDGAIADTRDYLGFTIARRSQVLCYGSACSALLEGHQLVRLDLPSGAHRSCIRFPSRPPSGSGLLGLCAAVHTESLQGCIAVPLHDQSLTAAPENQGWYECTDVVTIDHIWEYRITGTCVSNRRICASSKQRIFRIYLINTRYCTCWNWCLINTSSSIEVAPGGAVGSHRN
jgi:hypothetical protein